MAIATYQKSANLGLSYENGEFADGKKRYSTRRYPILNKDVIDEDIFLTAKAIAELTNRVLYQVFKDKTEILSQE